VGDCRPEQGPVPFHPDNVVDYAYNLGERLQQAEDILD